MTAEEASNFERILIEKLDTIKNGYNISKGGLHGLYEEYFCEETIRRMKKVAKERFSIPSNNTNASKVICEDIVFGSLIDCAKYYDITVPQLRNYLNGKTVMPDFFITNSLRYLDKETKIKTVRDYRKGKKKKRTIKCVELDKKFDSILSASKFYNIPSGNIVKVCQGLLETAGGFHWEYLNE